VGNVKPLLVVTGTRREGAVVAGEGVIVLAGGGAAARLRAELDRLAPTSCGIISFGTAGALDPALAIGDLVIGNSVAGASGCDCDPAWVQALSRRLPRARIGPVFATGALVAGTNEKASAAGSEAIIADMESHLVGAAAAHWGLPFAILRCVSDTSETGLPPAVAVAMRPNGALAPGAVLMSVLRQPGQLPALVRTGIGFCRAFAHMKVAAAAAGPRLAFDQCCGFQA
jgi:adenosylhomocysteine nucleosidase